MRPDGSIVSDVPILVLELVSWIDSGEAVDL